MKNKSLLLSLLLTVCFLLGLLCGCTGESALPKEAAARFGDSVLSAKDFMYYYCATVNAYVSQNRAQMEQLGYDFNLSPSEQTSTYNGKTWNEIFISAALNSAMKNISLYESAVENGYPKDETAVKVAVEEKYKSATSGASLNNMSVNEFLHAYYGRYCTKTYFREMARRAYIAQTYAGDVYSDVSVSEKDVEDYVKNNPDDFLSVDFRIFSFYAGEGENAKLEETEAAARSFYDAVTDEASFVSKAGEVSGTEGEQDATLYRDFLLSEVDNEEIENWFRDESRQPGDKGLFFNTDRYYVLMYLGRGYLDYELVNVGILPASNEKRAKELQSAFDNTARTDEAFLALSKDAGIRTDLAKDVLSAQADQWIFHESRKAGDSLAIEYLNNWYLVYYSGKSGNTFQKYSATTTIRDGHYTEWLSDLKDRYEMNSVNDDVIAEVIRLIEGQGK